MRFTPLRVVAALTSLAGALHAQDPRVGAIDFYGIRTVSRASIEQALAIRPGDTLIINDGNDLRRIEQRLLAVPGVRRASVNPVCCEANRTTLYVGIDDGGLAASPIRANPAGTALLPASIVKLGDDADAALQDAILRGVFGEDQSQGHSLSNDSTLRGIQRQFIRIATQNVALLREVLRSSSDARHRALAAQIIAYVPDKREVVRDLAEATRDSSSAVRNAATRALWPIAQFAQREPQRKITVPFEPFVDMLNSLVWTDVNKASLALMALSETRDPALLDLLRRRARPALIDIAQWRASGHSTPGLVLLGRIAGLDDTAIAEAIAKGDKDAIIRRR